jgi:tetratricopeptide (TPR) repeat protein
MGCDTLCQSYDNRADAYMKLGDYQHALADVNTSIKRTMSNAVYLINIDSFRKLYPEYDDIADDVLTEKLRKLFYPQMAYTNFAKRFLIDSKMEPTFILVDLYLKRGEIYTKLGQVSQAEREFDRVERVFPEFAAMAFNVQNGKRVRVKD